MLQRPDTTSYSNTNTKVKEPTINISNPHFSFVLLLMVKVTLRTSEKDQCHFAQFRNETSHIKPYV